MAAPQKITPEGFEFFKNHYYEKCCIGFKTQEMPLEFKNEHNQFDELKNQCGYVLYKDIFTPTEMMAFYIVQRSAYLNHQGEITNLSQIIDLEKENKKALSDLLIKNERVKNEFSEKIDELISDLWIGLNVFSQISCPDYGSMQLLDYFSIFELRFRFNERRKRSAVKKFLKCWDKFEYTLKTDKNYLLELNRGIEINIAGVD
ncbi:MAG: hypothetical protein Q8O89_02345 [Nanoarchaeota archaeon]|nr:hypothetical protein [Nanoarchaeota archaeon]